MQSYCIVVASWCRWAPQSQPGCLCGREVCKPQRNSSDTGPYSRLRWMRFHATGWCVSAHVIFLRKKELHEKGGQHTSSPAIPHAACWRCAPLALAFDSTAGRNWRDFDSRSPTPAPIYIV